MPADPLKPDADGVIVLVENYVNQTVTKSFYLGVDVTSASDNVQITVAAVTANTLIFTTMACVISHHIGLNHSSFEAGMDMMERPVFACLFVVPTKHNIWELSQKTSVLVRFGMLGAVSDTARWARSKP